jgi:hypothetical protein
MVVMSAAISLVMGSREALVMRRCKLSVIKTRFSVFDPETPFSGLSEDGPEKPSLKIQKQKYKNYHFI